MEIFLSAPDVLLGDIGQLEARFGLFGDSVNLRTGQVHGLRRMYTGMETSSGRTNGTPR
jgi:hypothetical protein